MKRKKCPQLIFDLSTLSIYSNRYLEQFWASTKIYVNVYIAFWLYTFITKVSLYSHRWATSSERGLRENFRERYKTKVSATHLFILPFLEYLSFAVDTEHVRHYLGKILGPLISPQWQMRPQYFTHRYLDGSYQDKLRCTSWHQNWSIWHQQLQLLTGWQLQPPNHSCPKLLEDTFGHPSLMAGWFLQGCLWSGHIQSLQVTSYWHLGKDKFDPKFDPKWSLFTLLLSLYCLFTSIFFYLPNLSVWLLVLKSALGCLVISWKCHFCRIRLLINSWLEILQWAIMPKRKVGKETVLWHLFLCLNWFWSL